MNKMAGRTPGAQETWQETPSHSVLHNYASTLPWIDIYTANTAFPLPRSHSTHSPPPRLDTRSKSPPRTALEGQSRELHGSGVLRGWISVAMELQGERNWKQIGAQAKPGKRRAGKKGGKPLYVQRRPTLPYTRPGQV